MDAGTIAVIAIGVMAIAVTLTLWGIGLWRRREKVKVKVTNVSYPVGGGMREIRVYAGIEFRRSGGNDIRYIRQVVLKPDQEIYGQLRQYFDLPSDGVIRWNARIEFPRDRVISSFNNLEPLTYKALPGIQSAEDRDKAKPIATQLEQQSHRIGLVWEDSGKTTWKSVSAENFSKWV